MKKVSRENLDALFAAIAEAKKLYLPVADGTDEKRGAKYSVWTPEAKYAAEAVNTVRSAKDFFFPQVENMVNFKVNGKKIEVGDIRTECEDFVIFGVRGCDAKSFEILDRVFLVDPRDEFYASRRAHGIVVTLACGEPEESCFCTNFGVNPANPGGDVTAWIVGEEMFLQANTEKGEKLIAELDEADKKAAEDEQARISEIAQKLPLNGLNLEGFDGEHLMEKFNDPKWESLSRACLGCGTCTFVCPTCQCYDIRDFDNGKSVTRYRCWDSCMYSDFTLMAAENSRHTQLQRYRQRFMHKLVYFPANNEGVYSCVGCGRCVEKCPQGLNIVRVIKALGVNEK